MPFGGQSFPAVSYCVSCNPSERDVASIFPDCAETRARRAICRSGFCRDQPAGPGRSSSLHSARQSIAEGQPGLAAGFRMRPGRFNGRLHMHPAPAREKGLAENGANRGKELRHVCFLEILHCTRRERRICTTSAKGPKQASTVLTPNPKQN